jgi:hypothetical protein
MSYPTIFHDSIYIQQNTVTSTGGNLKIDQVLNVDTLVKNTSAGIVVDGRTIHTDGATLDSTTSTVTSHVANISNPHSTTLAQLRITSNKGDIMVDNGTAVVDLPVGTNGQVLTANSSGTTGISWQTPGSTIETAVLWELQTTGTRPAENGGSAGDASTTTDTNKWQTRTLTTIAPSGGTTHISLSSNTITLLARTYLIEGSCPAGNTSVSTTATNHKTRLYNTTSGTVAIEGTSEAVYTGFTRSFFSGIITPSTSTTYQVQHYLVPGTVLSLPISNVSFGNAAGLVSTDEIYSTVNIIKIA